MGNVVINGLNEKIFFNAPNYYGANLKVSVYDDGAGEFIVSDVPMTEIVEPVDSIDANVSGDHVKDVKIVTLDTVDGIIPSDRIKINTEIYRVTKVNSSDNTVELHKGLIEDVADATSVDKVGNMSIYKIMLLITRDGAFIIQAKDTKYGLQYSDSITVKPESLEDLFDKTNAEINENERIIKETSGFQIII